MVYPDGLDRSWADGRGVTPSDKNNVSDVKILSGLIVAASMSDILASSCDPAKPVSVLLMQGSKDPLAPFAGGSLGKNGDRGTVLPHADAMKEWVALDHCTGDPTIETIPDKVGDGTSINARTYSHCDGGSEVADYSVIDGGHAWPGGVPYSAEFLIGKTSKNLNANEVIWEFFAKHSR